MLKCRFRAGKSLNTLSTTDSIIVNKYELTRESYILTCTSTQDRNHVLFNVYECFILFCSVDLKVNTER
jgi:hypothetical protein